MVDANANISICALLFQKWLSRSVTCPLTQIQTSMESTLVQKPDAIQIEMGEDGKTLRLLLDPRGSPLPKSVSALTERIREAGFGELFVFNDVLKTVPDMQRKCSAPTWVDIGERRDGTVAVKVTDDGMEAYVTITRPCGGKAITRDDVRFALRAASVVSGIQQDLIERCVREASGESTLVAKGTPAQNGEPARFECRVRRASGAHPKLKSDGRVDLRELGTFVTVKVGDVLMVKVPPTPGVPGTNIHGQVLPVIPGADADFAEDLEGVQRHPRDRNTLVAAVAGRPIILDNGVSVDTNLEIKNVDISTGNLHFAGDVTIRGDVRAGCCVVATGSVTVGGTVEAATVEAGGDIIVELGAIGRGEVRDENGILNPSAAVLRAGGSIQARYLYNALVESGRDVSIAEAVTHSEIHAKHCVTVGAEGAKKGHLIGGRVVAEDRIQVQVLGSPAHVKTFVEVGAAAEVVHAHNEIAEQLEKKMEDQEKLHVLEEQLKERPRPDLKERIERATAKLQAEIAELTAKADALIKQVDDKQGACIVVTQAVYGGTQVQCNGRIETVPDKKGPGTFAIRNQKLTYE